MFDREFHHDIVKVAVDRQSNSRVDLQTTRGGTVIFVSGSSKKSDVTSGLAKKMAF